MKSFRAKCYTISCSSIQLVLQYLEKSVCYCEKTVYFVQNLKLCETYSICLDISNNIDIYTGRIPQRLDTNVHSAVTAKTSTAR